MAKIEAIEVIILHSVAGPKHLTFNSGERVYLPVEIAKEWIAKGLAEQVEQAAEIKVIPHTKTPKKGK